MGGTAERRTGGSRRARAPAPGAGGRPRHRGRTGRRCPARAGRENDGRRTTMGTSRIDALKTMIDRNPNDPRLRFGLALEYEKLGEWEQVVRELQEYLALAEDELLLKLGEWEQVVRELQEYLALAEDEGNAWGRLGNALRELGRDDEAKDAYRKGIDAAYRHGHPSMAAEFEEILEEWA